MTSIFLLTLVATISVAVLLAIRWDEVGRLQPASMGLPPDGEKGEVGPRRSQPVPEPSDASAPGQASSPDGVGVQLLFVRPDRGGFLLDCVLLEPLNFDGGELPAGLPVVLTVRPPRHNILGAAIGGILEGWAAEGRMVRLQFVSGTTPKRVRLEADTSRVQLDLVSAPKLR